MFRMVASFVGLRYAGVPLAPDFDLDLPAMESAIRAASSCARSFSPTRTTRPATCSTPPRSPASSELRPGLVVVDEAYHAFAGESFLPRLERHPNLLVMRTLSKLGLAGLRLGLLAGRDEWLRELDKVRLPYNVNVLTQASCAARARPHGRAERAGRFDPRRALAAVCPRLSAVPGVHAFPSRANFMLFRVPHADARIRRAQGARRPDQESERIAPHAGRVPARHGRHARRRTTGSSDALQSSLEQAA